MLNETSIPLSWLRDTIAVYRTFPIRVGGNSGNFGNAYEYSNWQTFSEARNNPRIVPEVTTVTNRIRRVATMDPEQLKRSLFLNQPTRIALTFVDYLL